MWLLPLLSYTIFVDSSTQKKAIVFSFEIWFKSFEMDFFVSWPRISVHFLPFKDFAQPYRPSTTMVLWCDRSRLSSSLRFARSAFFLFHHLLFSLFHAIYEHLWNCTNSPVCSKTKLPLAKFSFGWWWIADHSTDY